MFHKIIHFSSLCFPNPQKKKLTSPTGNYVTLGDTKAYKKGQQNSTA